MNASLLMCIFLVESYTLVVLPMMIHQSDSLYLVVHMCIILLLLSELLLPSFKVSPWSFCTFIHDIHGTDKNHFDHSVWLHLRHQKQLHISGLNML